MNRPAYCPMVKPGCDTSPIESCECCQHTRSDDPRGGSSYCIGKIQRHVFIVNGKVHDNDHLICLYAPGICEPRKMITTSQIMNEKDMEALHTLIHTALDHDGFMNTTETIREEDEL